MGYNSEQHLCCVIHNITEEEKNWLNTNLSKVRICSCEQNPENEDTYCEYCECNVFFLEEIPIWYNAIKRSGKYAENSYQIISGDYIPNQETAFINLANCLQVFIREFNRDFVAFFTAQTNNRINPEDMQSFAFRIFSDRVEKISLKEWIQK